MLYKEDWEKELEANKLALESHKKGVEILTKIVEMYTKVVEEAESKPVEKEEELEN